MAAGARSAEGKVPTAKDAFAMFEQGKRIPVIFDTDIGGDIDDTWALVMLLRSPELEVKLALFDTVAVYLACTEELVRMEKLGIRVTDDGQTLIDPNAKGTNCAMTWKDLGAFEDELVRRLMSTG